MPLLDGRGNPSSLVIVAADGSNSAHRSPLPVVISGV